MINNLLYPIIYGLFILSINALSTPKRAYRGNYLAIIAMGITIILNFAQIESKYLIPALIFLLLGATIGITTAQKIKMQNLPQMVALLNGLGGLSAGIIGITEASAPKHPTILVLLIMSIGFMTFSGSVAALIKLSKSTLPFDTKTLKIAGYILFFISVISGIYAYFETEKYISGFAVIISLYVFFLILPIGGSDMSIVISLLNSFSGWSTVLVGFSLNNILMIIVGTLVGSSGTILSYIMTKTMNRPILKVLFSPINNESKQEQLAQHYNIGSPQDAAFLMENANKVIIVPGFGMAVSNAQNEITNMAKILIKKYNVDVKFAIHPVAGRMPGHINVLLAEANAPENIIFELNDINQEFQTADVVYVIGANDIVNPLTKTKKDSSIYRMPILEVADAKRIIFVKRTLNPGYSGIDNPLFYEDKTLMLLGDAKEITKKIVTLLEK